MKNILSKFSLIALLLLAACTPGHKNSGQESAMLQKPAPMVAEPPTVTPKGLLPSSVPSIKVALLLPLSGDSIAVGNAMLDAATMAISDTYLTTPSEKIHCQLVLLPKDTGNVPADSGKSIQQAIDQGARFVIGPLFSQSVTVVAPIAHAHKLTMLTFSNNKNVAGEDIYLFGFLPEQQVLRMAEYAYLHNLQRVALLAPNDSYGEKVKTTLVEAYAQKGGTVTPTEMYAPSPANIDAAVSRLAAAYNNTTDDRRFQAIFVADGGNQLKNIMASIKKNHIDLKKVKLLGTGLWDDPEIIQIPELEGAWFPSSPPGPYATFEKRFVATYGYKPIRLASLAYDAVALASTLAMATPEGTIGTADLTVPAGYISPANGLFRFNTDGTSDRKLAIMEVTPQGFKVIDPALRNF